MSRVALGDVPSDVILEIFGFCTLAQTSALASTCQYWRYLALQHTDRMYLLQCMLRGKTEEHKWGEVPLVCSLGNGVMVTPPHKAATVAPGHLMYVDMRPSAEMRAALPWTPTDGCQVPDGIAADVKTLRHSLHYAPRSKRIVHNVWSKNACVAWLTHPQLKPVQVSLPEPGARLHDVCGRFLLMSVILPSYSTDRSELSRMSFFFVPKASTAGAVSKPCTSAATELQYFVYATEGTSLLMLILSDQVVQSAHNLIVGNTASVAKWSINLYRHDLLAHKCFTIHAGHCAQLTTAVLNGDTAFLLVHDPYKGCATFMKVSFDSDAVTVVKTIPTAVMCLDVGNCGDALVFDSDGYALYDVITTKKLYRRDTSSIREDQIFTLGEWRSNTKNLPVALETTSASLVIRDFDQYRSLRLAGVQRPDEADDEEVAASFS